MSDTAPFFYDLVVVERNMLPRAGFLFCVEYPLSIEYPLDILPGEPRKVIREKLITNALLSVQNNFNFRRYRMGDIYRRTWAIYRQLNDEYRRPKPTRKLWVPLDVIRQVLFQFPVNKKKLYVTPTYTDKEFLVSSYCWSDDLLDIFVDSKYKYLKYKNLVLEVDNGSDGYKYLECDKIKSIRMGLGYQFCAQNLVLEVDNDSDVKCEDIDIAYPCIMCDSYIDAEKRTYEDKFQVTLCQKCYDCTDSDMEFDGGSWVEKFHDMVDKYFNGKPEITVDEQ